MKKTLLCSMMLAVFGGVSATQKSVTPVSAEDPMVLPYNSAELQAGTLDYEHSHLYDLICEGRCNLERKENMIPAVLHMDKIPNFVEVCKSGDNAGEIVFTTPQPMGTVTLPAGHDAYVTITLQKLKSEFEKTDTDPKAAEYVALGVREQGSSDFLRILRRPYDVPAENPNEELQKKNEESVCLRMNSNNTLELVPLLSANNMLTDNCGEVKPQTIAKTWTAISALNPSDFNFGSVFRVDVACTKDESEMSWKDTGWSTITGRNSGLSYAHGIFVIEAGGSNCATYWLKKGQTSWKSTSVYGGRYLFFSQRNNQHFLLDTNGNVYTTEDCDIPNVGSSTSICCGVDLGGKFIVATYNGNIYSLVDGETAWSGPTAALADLYSMCEYNDISDLVYGDGVLIAMTSYGWMSISDDGGNHWSIPQKPFSFASVSLAYGDGKFLALDHTSGNLLSSTNKGQTWESGGNIGHTDIDSFVYGGDAFYAISNNGIYRSPRPYINLIK